MFPLWERRDGSARHRLLGRLAESGLVTVTTEGKQKYYQANPRSPVYTELHGLAVKTSGLVEPIRRALARSRSEIEVAFIYGSVAGGGAKSSSDVDLLVVSDHLTYPDLIQLLQPRQRSDHFSHRRRAWERVNWRIWPRLAI